MDGATLQRTLPEVDRKVASLLRSTGTSDLVASPPASDLREREEPREVEISPRARALREAQLSGELPHEPPPPATVETRHRESVQPVDTAFLAARVGPAPVDIAVDPEELIRERLNERAGLRRVEEVLSDLSPEEKRELELLGSRRREFEPLPLLGVPGEEGPPGSATRAEPPERLVSTRSLAARDAERIARDPDEAAEERERESVARGDDQQALTRVGAVAGHSGAVRDPEHSGERADASGERQEPAGEAVARRTLTQNGLLEARAEHEIVNRFLDGVPHAEPGPTPAPREHLDQRSTPL